jgi:hypothetical protein
MELKQMITSVDAQISTQVDNMAENASVAPSEKSKILDENNGSKHSTEKTKDSSGQKKHEDLILGDSVTKVLKPKKMSGSKINTKIRSHPGAKICDITNKIVSSDDKRILKECDVFVIHAGINNISDGDNENLITDELNDLTNELLKENSGAKVIVCSVLPKCRDNLATKIIDTKVNTSITNLCKRKDLTFLDNTSAVIYQGTVNDQLYQDAVHLTKGRGAAILGKQIKKAIYSALALPYEISEDVNFPRTAQQPKHPPQYSQCQQMQQRFLVRPQRTKNQHRERAFQNQCSTHQQETYFSHYNSYPHPQKCMNSHFHQQDNSQSYKSFNTHLQQKNHFQVNPHYQQVNLNPQQVNPNPQQVTLHQQQVNPHLQEVNPQQVTPHQQQVNPHQQRVNPHPQQVTPHQQQVTSHPQHINHHSPQFKLQRDNPHHQQVNPYPQQVSPHHQNVNPQPQQVNPQKTNSYPQQTNSYHQQDNHLSHGVDPYPHKVNSHHQQVNHHHQQVNPFHYMELHQPTQFQEIKSYPQMMQQQSITTNPA